MINVYKRVENNILAKSLLWTKIFMGILVIVLIVLDSRGYTADLSNKAIRGFGKQMGVLTIIVAVVAFLNYLLREIYIKIKKEKISLTQKFEEIYRNMMKNVRLLHPALGTIALYLATLHAYFIWLRGSTRITVTTGLGLSTFILLLLLLYVGLKIRLDAQNKQLRYKHKLLAYLFFALYLGHVFMKKLI